MDIFFNHSEAQRRSGIRMLAGGERGGKKKIHESYARRDVGKLMIKEDSQANGGTQVHSRAKHQRSTSFKQGGHVLLCLLRSKIVVREGEMKAVCR